MRDIFLGITPWIEGGLAAFTIAPDAIELEMHRLPVLQRLPLRLDFPAIAAILAKFTDDARVEAAIEAESYKRTGAHLKEADVVVQVQIQAAWRSALALRGIPMREVGPRDWRDALVPEKRWITFEAVGPARQAHANKAHPFHRAARRVFPGLDHMWPLKKDGARAAAALVALWGAAEAGRPWAIAMVEADRRRPDRAVRPGKANLDAVGRLQQSRLANRVQNGRPPHPVRP